MKKPDLLERTQNFGVRIMNLVEHLPSSRSSIVIANQLLRSATSIGANYRAVQRAKSSRDFVNKLKIVEEETDETLFWIELIEKGKIFPSGKIRNVRTEAMELLSIFVASLKTAKINQEKRKYEVKSTKFKHKDKV
jgi:four helix bundle protein